MLTTLVTTLLVALVAATLGAFVAARVARASANSLREQFTAVSVDALDANGHRFLRMAREQLAPVSSKLAEVDAKLTAFDRARAESAGHLHGQIQALRASGEQLREGTTALTRALRQPQGRGQWGELQLRRVVELAGMSEHTRDFSVQQSTVTDDDRRLRPDMVVHMPNGRCVVIDSKVPLDAFLSAMEASDDEAAAPHLARHAEQVRTHVTQLARKDYSQYLDGALADMVVLFLPAEHLFAAAVRVRPTIIEEAFERGIVIASPTTLLTLLHAVGIGWKDERIARNAEEIAALGRELHERIALMADKFARVGRGLETASRAYNEAIGSLESRVLPTTRRFEALDAAKASRSIPEMEGVSTAPRAMAAPELTLGQLPRTGSDY
ncbi:MAG: hypothetical protein JWM86_303 [Thermoleophilia bacterium]|nr:hypothetical protein [Thermoleophilia bacterium]